jgi:hypothetical protein
MTSEKGTGNEEEGVYVNKNPNKGWWAEFSF